jgi:hypothetical protein
MSKSRINKALLIRNCEKARSEYYNADIARLQADDDWSQACLAFDKAREQIGKADKRCKETSAALREAKRIYEEMRMNCFKQNINPFNELTCCYNNDINLSTQQQTK